MLVEIPIFRRCCFCLPLRRGILTFGYLNLLITIFFGVLHILIWWVFGKKNYAVAMYRGVVLEADMYLVVTLHLLDVVFNVLLIVGAHMRNSKFMRAYYYYQITTMIANFLVLVVTYSYVGMATNWEVALSEIGVAFIGFVIQIYLLLLVHSELNKDRYQEGRTSFVNQTAEVFVEPPRMQDRRILL